MTNSLAQLDNLKRCHMAALKVINRPDHLPGIITFTGPSGLGKTISTGFAVQKTNGCYVEVRSTWTVKFFCEQICLELGIEAEKTIAAMIHSIADALMSTGRPLFIDEADHIIKKRYIEAIRDIYELSKIPIILIGEEMMPLKLKKESERFANRILDHITAQPASAEDARKLAELYCKEITISPELIEVVRQSTRGVVRRMCVNFELIMEFGRTNNIGEIGIEEWKGNELNLGYTPKKRVAA